MQTKIRCPEEDRFVFLEVITQNGNKYEFDIEILDEHFSMPEIQLSARLNNKHANTIQLSLPGKVLLRENQKWNEYYPYIVYASNKQMGGVWLNWQDNAFDPHEKEIKEILAANAANYQANKIQLL